MPISRKVATRLVGAPILLAVLGGLLAWGDSFERAGRLNQPLGILLCLVGLTALDEVGGMARARSIPFAGRTAGTALLLCFAGWMNWLPGMDLVPDSAVLPLVTTGLVLVLLGLMVFRYGAFTPDGAGMTLLGFGYISLVGFLLHTPVPRGVGTSTWYLVFLLAAGKGSDMAAYSAGKLFGRHKMTPVVSPNKTWEGGIAGGIAGTLLAFWVARGSPIAPLFAPVPAPALLVLCLFVTIAAQVGDLVKSALKRWAGVKDSGRLLPEFGGMLDMVDSFLLAAPAAHLGVEILRHVFRTRG
jgi:phosphatidate cytidylyltransferase